MKKQFLSILLLLSPCVLKAETNEPIGEQRETVVAGLKEKQKFEMLDPMARVQGEIDALTTVEALQKNAQEKEQEQSYYEWICENKGKTAVGVTALLALLAVVYPSVEFDSLFNYVSGLLWGHEGTKKIVKGVGRVLPKCGSTPGNPENK